MKTRKWFRQFSFKILLVVIVLISVGFALLTTNLKIYANSKLKAFSWNVHFENLRLDNNSTCDNHPVLSFEQNFITFNAEFSEPNDNLAFYVDIVNEGSVDARINSVYVDVSSEYLNYIDYTLTYTSGEPLSNNQLIKANSRYTVYFNIYYKDLDAYLLPNYDISFNVNIGIEYRTKNRDSVILDYSELESGSFINSKMETLASDKDNIKGILKATSLKSGLTSNNIISTEGSIPVYMWFEEDEIANDGSGFIYWYSEAYFINMEYAHEAFDGLTNLYNIDSLSFWNIRGATSLYNTFRDCAAITSFNPIKGWDFNGVTSFESAFEGCSSIIDADFLANAYNTGLTNLSSMFKGCISLDDISGLYNWDTDHVTSMNSIFMNTAITSTTSLQRWATNNLVDLSYSFSGCSNLTDISYLNAWAFTTVTNMSNMFANCTSLRQLTNIEFWNIVNVQDMSYMFMGVSLNSYYPLYNWGGNTSSVQDMEGMFYQSNVSDLSFVANWNVSSVVDMSYMFDGCSQLYDISGIYSWQNNNVQTTAYMFANCTSLSDITPLTYFYKDYVINFSYMFYGCTSLLDASCLEYWSIPITYDTTNMFDPVTTITPSWYHV